MKTLRSFLNGLIPLSAAGLLFAGCYTHTETVSERWAGGDDDYAYTDTTSSSDSTSASYFDDDSYRDAQYHMAFDYYYPPPEYYASAVGYDPWFDYNYYPWGLWYPYGFGFGWGYGYGYGYGGYYGHAYHGWYGGRNFATRQRTIGSGRGSFGYFAGRAAPNSPGRVIPANGVTPSRGRTPNAPGAVATSPSASRTRQEIPWWQRANRSTVASRQATVASRGRYSSYGSRNSNVRQMYQHRGRVQPLARYAQPQSRQMVHQGYSAPQRSSGRASSGGGGSRGGGGGRNRGR